MRTEILKMLMYCVPFIKHLIFNESTIKDTVKTNRAIVILVVLFIASSMLTISVTTLWTKARVAPTHVSTVKTDCADLYDIQGLRKLMEEEK